MMMGKMITLIVCLSMEAVALSNVYSLSELKENARKLNNSLLSQRENLNKLEAQLQFSRSNYFPQITLSSGVGKTLFASDLTSSIGTTAPVQQDYTTNSEINLSQLIFSFGKVSSVVDTARASKSLGEKRYKETLNKLLLEIEKSYHNVIFTQKVKDIYSESLENAQKTEKLISRGSSSIRRSRADILKAKRDSVSRVPDVINAEKDIVLAYKRLKYYSGIDLGEEITISDSEFEKLAIASYDQLKEVSEKNSIAIKVAKSQVDFTNNQYVSSKRQFYPTISTYANFRANGGDETIAFDSGGAMRRTSSIGLLLTLSIYEGGSKFDKVNETYSDFQAAQYNLKDAIELNNFTLKSYHQEFLSYEKQLRENKDFLELAEKSYKQSEDRFRNGQTTILELNDSEQLLTQAKLQVIQSEFQLANIKSDIDYFILESL